MLFYKTAAAVLVLTALSGAIADKKIELQDIEEDNLKSEKDKSEGAEQQEYKARPTVVVTGGGGTGRAADLHPLDYIKNGFLRLYETPVQLQAPRYVQQYAVTENQERTSGAPETTVQKPEYASAGAAQPMLGYLSNVPMQILYIPQYYADPTQHSPGVQYAAPVSKVNVGSYHAQETAPEQSNYIEVPTYLAPSGKGYASSMPQYSPQVTYVTYGPPQATSAVSPTALPSPVAPPAAPAYTAVAAPASYAMPLLSYPQPAAPPPLYRPYYPSYTHYETNAVDEAPSNDAEPQKEYAATEKPYTKPVGDSPRYYTSSRLLKGERGQSSHVSELPPPSPLLYQSQPPHLAGIPKVLPYHRPPTKPFYSHFSGNLIPNASKFSPYSYTHQKRPTSLLDSYVPSSVQLEYMKRGLGRDPLSTYEALSTAGGRYMGGGGAHAQPRQLERGFLPNQIYHTAAGGVTYGHYKRASGGGQASQKIHK